MKNLIILIHLFFILNAQAQFTGHSGVYYLGTANVPISNTNYNNVNISGVVIRFNWNDIEPTPGSFNWTYIDSELAKAKANNKKVCLQPLGTTAWLGNIGALQYFNIDRNNYHTTFGQVISGVIPWDSIYVSRYKILLQNLASKYANDTTVTYINTIGGAFSRGLPDSVLIDTTLLITQPFWTTYNYNADTFGHLMNQMTDYYMGLFPNTHLWCSVDYVSFQPNATGQLKNYLASLYTSYGVANYSSRFGLWREDVSACNPNLLNINAGSQWKIMQQNPCRTGAQMLWNVQDGPTRMNQCGVSPNTKAMVLDSAVNKGLSLGMRYLEIYGIDITDPSISTSIQQANNKLISRSIYCNSTIGIDEPIRENLFSISPNPATDILDIDLNIGQYPEAQIRIFNSMGALLKEISVVQKAQLNISDLSDGLYFIQVKKGTEQTLKFIKQ